MDKYELEKYLKKGLSTRDISSITGLHYNTISYWIKKYDLNDLLKYKKNDNFSFEKIDTKEKAYVLGFLLADSSICNKICEISISIKDKDVLNFISQIINGNVFYDMTYDKKTKRFPRARLTKKIKDICKFTGGEKKKERHYPIVKKEFEKYLMQGFFEADGCITWGYRKDRNKIWQKISIKSSFSILEGFQKALINQLNISTRLYPVKNEDCYCIDFSNKKDVLKFLNFIYPDDSFIIMKRKYLKQNALRFDLEENGESCINTDNTVPSLQSRKV